MKSIIHKYKSLRFWFGLVIPVVFILVSLSMMRDVGEKRQRIANNIALISQFSQLESQFKNLELQLVSRNVDGLNWEEIRREGIRIHYALDTMRFYLSEDLPLVKEQIVRMDSLANLIVELKMQLFRQLMPSRDMRETESEVKNKIALAMEAIGVSVVQIRQDMTMVSLQLNSLWNKLFYLLLSACVIAFLLVIYLILYRRQLYNKEQIELSLRASEKRNSALLDAIPDMMFLISREGIYLDFKPSKELSSIISPKIFLGRNVADFFPEEEAKQAMHHIRKALDTGQTQHYEYQLNLEGKLFEFEARLVKSGGDEVIGIVRDITERKQIDQALRISEERYTMAVKSGNVGVWDWDLGTDEIFIDPNLKRMLGYKDDEIQNRMEDWAALIHPADKESVMQHAQLHIEGKKQSFNLEHRMIHKDGGIIWFSTNGIAVRDREGKVYRMVGTDVNITDRKRAEEALQQQEEQLRRITEAIPVLISYIDKDFRYIFNNKAYERLFEVPEGSLRGKHIKVIYGEEGFKQVKQYFDKVVEGKFQRFVHTISSNGDKIFMDVSLVPDWDATGEVRGIYSAILDVTDLKKAEDQLAESEAKWRSIIENVEDAIINIDNKGTILSINKASQGFSKEQLIGQNLFEFLLSFDRQRVEEGVLNVFKSSRPYSYDVHFRGKDGSEVWYSNIATPIVKGGQVDSVIVVCRDMTHQKRAEAAVINAMVEGQDKERKRISEELHDGLGQALSSISMNFNALESKLKAGNLKPDDENLKNVKKQLNRTIREIRSISHDLMPDLLDEFGLVPALRDIADKLKGTGVLNLDIEFINMNQRLDKTVEVTLYRITQELVNNIVKHAKAAHAQIQIINHNESIVMVVEDDGVGFNLDDKSNGIGIKNITSRARVLNGDVIIDSAEGKGTVITIEIPLNTVTAD